MVLLALLARLDHDFALHARRLAELAVPAPLPGAARRAHSRSRARRRALDDGQPGHAGEQAQADAASVEQRPACAPVKPSAPRQRACRRRRRPRRRARAAARRAGCAAAAPRARRCERAAGEAGEATASGGGRSAARRRCAGSPRPPRSRQSADPPVGRQPEEIEQQVGEPGADAPPALCAPRRWRCATSPGRRGGRWRGSAAGRAPAATRSSHHASRSRPASFAGRGAAFACYGQVHSRVGADYSGSMIVSRSTMVEPRISM